MSKYKAVLFDLDGTLLDTLADLAVSVNTMLAALGYPLRSKEEVRSYLGNGVRHLVASALPKDADEETKDVGLYIFRSHYAVHSMEKTAPYRGVEALLRELKSRGVFLGVVTNKVDAAAQPMIDRYFPGIFDVVLGQRDEIPRKPAPDMIFAALKESGIAAEHCLYVGDSEVDHATADHAGVDCALVTWGYRDKEDLAPLAPAALIENAEDLLNIV